MIAFVIFWMPTKRFFLKDLFCIVFVYAFAIHLLYIKITKKMESIVIKSGTVMKMFDGKLWNTLKPLKNEMAVNAKKSKSGNSYTFYKSIGDSKYRISVDATKIK